MRMEHSSARRLACVAMFAGVFALTQGAAAQFNLEWQGFDGSPGAVWAVPAGTVPFWSVDGACSGAVIFNDGSRGDNGSNCLRDIYPVSVGTRMIRDLNPGPGGSTFGDMAILGYDVMWRFLVSAGGEADSGHELYSLVDPLHPVMRLRSDINPGPGSSTPTGFFEQRPNFRVFYSADNGTNGRELWLSNDNLRHRELGDIVLDINPGPASSDPAGFALAPSSVIVFAADDGTNGRELWKTQGTAANTTLLMDINATAPGASSDPQQMITSAHGYVYFTADDGIHGRELWKTNGTLAGTGLCLDIVAGPDGSDPTLLTAARLGGNVLTLVFTTNSDGVNGRELWGSSGVGFLGGSNTALIFDPGAAGDPQNLTAAQAINLLFFTVGNELWKTDGTAVGTVLVQSFVSPPANLLSVGSSGGNQIYFAADDGSGNGVELWRADASGAALVKDINPGPGSSSPANLYAIGTRVYFSADDGIHGRELWRTDPTEGALLIKDINPGPGGSDPERMLEFQGTVIFTADDGTHGRELWQTDGFAEPTRGGWTYKLDLASMVQDRSGDPNMVAVTGTDESVLSVYWLYDFPAMGQPNDMPSHGGHQINNYIELTDGVDRAPLDITYVDCGDGNLGRPRAALTDGTIHGAVAFGMVAVLDQNPCDEDWRGRFRPGIPYATAPAVFDGRDWIMLTLDNIPPGIPTEPPSGKVMGQVASGAQLVGGGLPPGLAPAGESPWATRRYAWARIDVATHYITVVFGNRQAGQIWVATVPRQYQGGFQALYAGNSACLQNPHPYYFDSLVINGGTFSTQVLPFGACCAPSGCSEVASAAECPDGKFSPWTACDDPGYLCCPIPWADSDRDGDVDSTDFGFFQRCYTGGLVGVAQECACLDSNNDNMIDEQDLLSFIQCSTGPGLAMDPVPAECGGL